MTFGKALMMAGLGVMLAASPAAADTSRKVKITFDGPVRVPGATLPAGTYVFSRLESTASTQSVVRVSTLDGNSSRLFLGQPVPRPVGAAEDSKIELGAAKDGLAPALKAFFYPGDDYGMMPVFKQGAQSAASTANTSIAD